MPVPSPHSSEPSRRAVAASAAWGVPVVAAAMAAPLASASPASCRSTTIFTTSDLASNPTVLTAVSPSGVRSMVRITSVLAPGTTTETQGQSVNLTRNRRVWSSRPGREILITGFGPNGALVLDQRREGQLSTPPSPGSDSQTLTFEFFDARGVAFSPLDLQLTIVNLASEAVAGAPWFFDNWSTVGFSTAPASISTSSTRPGAGTGTTADPYRTAGGNEPTDFGTPRTDTFSFGVFPSGSTLVYGQHDGRQGWHFSVLSALSFRSTDC